MVDRQRLQAERVRGVTHHTLEAQIPVADVKENGAIGLQVAQVKFQRFAREQMDGNAIAGKRVDN